MNRAFAYLAVSMMFRAIQEIAKWRPKLTYLPDWMFSTSGIFNLDGYHLFTTLHWILAIAAGVEMAKALNRRLKIWEMALIVVIGGAIHDLFYHTIFMKNPEIPFRDYIEGIMTILNWIFRSIV